MSDPALPAARDLEVWLGRLCHDLRNQLAPMRTASQLLLGGVAPERQREMLELIDGQILRLTRMLDDVSELAHQREGHADSPREACDLARLVDSALGECGRHISASAQRLEYEVPKQPVPVVVERTRVARCILRLLDNAHRFTPNGGRITIRIESEAGWARLRIADNGRGLTADDIDEIFALPTARRNSERLGVSLHLSRACAQQQGGTLVATSMGAGHGSEFVLTLPQMS